MIVGWPLVVPSRQPLVVLPIRHDRSTLRRIRSEEVFSINVVPRSLASRALETFGVKAGDKLTRWGNVSPCINARCRYLGDSAAHIECVYDGEWQVGDYALVKCRAVYWECRNVEHAEFAMCGTIR